MGQRPCRASRPAMPRRHPGSSRLLLSVTERLDLATMQKGVLFNTTTLALLHIDLVPSPHGDNSPFVAATWEDMPMHRNSPIPDKQSIRDAGHVPPVPRWELQTGKSRLQRLALSPNTEWRRGSQLLPCQSHQPCAKVMPQSGISTNRQHPSGLNLPHKAPCSGTGSRGSFSCGLP